MRIAVISDVHGNLPALEAVLDAVDDADIDELWCLGDTLGYGANPVECLARVAERAAIVLRGNHDLASIGAMGASEFTGVAHAAIIWTRASIGDHERRLLSQCGELVELDDPGILLCHGSPRDPVWEYVITLEAIEAAYAATRAKIILVGHSHFPIGLIARGRRIEGGYANAGSELAYVGGRLLANPGSVGQPRDRDPRASWLELDLDRETAIWHRVEYDVAEAARRIVDAGLPKELAQRLASGK